MIGYKTGADMSADLKRHAHRVRQAVDALPAEGNRNPRRARMIQRASVADKNGSCPYEAPHLRPKARHALYCALVFALLLLGGCEASAETVGFAVASAYWSPVLVGAALWCEDVPWFRRLMSRRGVDDGIEFTLVVLMWPFASVFGVVYCVIVAAPYPFRLAVRGARALPRVFARSRRAKISKATVVA